MRQGDVRAVSLAASRRTKALAAAAVIVFAASAVLLSVITRDDAAVITFVKGSVRIESRGTSRSAAAAQQLRDGDTVITGENSSLVLQSGDGVTVRFEPGTSAVIAAFEKPETRSIALREGTVLSRVGKLSKQQSFEVTTPAGTASVRGTEFLTAYHEGKARVAVSRGKVAVSKSAQAEQLAETGQCIEIADTLELRQMNRQESLMLSRLDNTPEIEKPAGKNSGELASEFRAAEQADARIDNELPAETGAGKNLTIDELRQKYRRIDVLVLFDGRRIEGVIVSRGDPLTILTPSGEQSVPVKGIQRIEAK